MKPQNKKKAIGSSASTSLQGLAFIVFTQSSSSVMRVIMAESSENFKICQFWELMEKSAVEKVKRISANPVTCNANLTCLSATIQCSQIKQVAKEVILYPLEQMVVHS